MPNITEYIDAIKEARGLITAAAARLGVSRQSIYNMAARHASIQQALDDARERMTDLAEGKLFSKVNDGDMTAIIFYLKTQGKKRGYVERQEIEHSSQGDIVIDLTRVGQPNSDSQE